ncbi:MAG: hypothetical protein WCS43_04340, partial [Verrucomicrobiota bacterium]
MEDNSVSKKNTIKAIVAGILIAGSAVAADVTPLGEMNGFYRYTAVLGPLLEKGHRLCTIPDWMLETDFPYQKRPSPLEIPFADG